MTVDILQGPLLDDVGPPPRLSLIYVIDDHTDILASLNMLLGTFGISVRPFASAHAFLDALPSLPPAPILLDINMARMTGIELLENLGASGVQWPVITMTGFSEPSVASRALGLGAIEALTKPFSADELELSLSRAFAALAARTSAPH